MLVFKWFEWEIKVNFISDETWNVQDNKKSNIINLLGLNFLRNIVFFWAEYLKLNLNAGYKSASYLINQWIFFMHFSLKI